MLQLRIPFSTAGCGVWTLPVSSLEELQRDLGRRFQVVRRALLRLERSGKVERVPSSREDLETWYIVK